VVVQVGRELAGAIAARDEIQGLRGRRQRRRQRLRARQGDRRGRQAAARVGIVRGVGFQVAFADLALVLSPMP
jgi:hypothetical protein